MPALIVGTGSHVYDVVQDFAILPSGMSFGHTNDVAVDSQGTLYVTQRDGPPVLVFDASGSYQGALARACWPIPAASAPRPTTTSWWRTGTRTRCWCWTPRGRFSYAWASRASPSCTRPSTTHRVWPWRPTGDILVADGYGNSCVHRFSADGQLIRSWGSPGAEPGHLSIPNGLWVDGQDRVYVADRDNLRLQVFDGEGGFLAEWRDLSRPMAVWGDSAGRIYVTDMVPRLSVYTAEGELLSRGKLPRQARHVRRRPGEPVLHRGDLRRDGRLFGRGQAGGADVGGWLWHDRS